MTMEEMQAMLEAQQEALAKLQASVEDLTAERDSLSEELEKSKTAAAAAAVELAETKKLNFTLARQVNTGKQDPEEILAEMLKRR